MASHLIIVWSGGFDSTAVLLSVLARATDPEYIDTRIHLVSCYMENASNRDEDKKARDAIKDWIKNSGSIPTPVVERVYFYESKMDFWGVHGSCGIQSPYWAALAGQNIPTGNADTSRVAFGYIKGDDFWHDKHAFEQIIKHTFELSAGPYSKAKYEVWYPFEWQTKKEMLIHYIPYSNVLQIISWAGDTSEIKLKEKHELLDTFGLMISAIQVDRDMQYKVSGEHAKKEACAMDVQKEISAPKLDLEQPPEIVYSI